MGKTLGMRKTHLMSSSCCSVKVRVGSRFQGGAISRWRGEVENSSFSSLEELVRLMLPLSEPASPASSANTGGFLQQIRQIQGYDFPLLPPSPF